MDVIRPDVPNAVHTQKFIEDYDRLFFECYLDTEGMIHQN